MANRESTNQTYITGLDKTALDKQRLSTMLQKKNQQLADSEARNIEHDLNLGNRRGDKGDIDAPDSGSGDNQMQFDADN